MFQWIRKLKSSQLKRTPMKPLSNFLNYKEFCAAILRLGTSQRSCVKSIHPRHADLSQDSYGT